MANLYLTIKIEAPKEPEVPSEDDYKELGNIIARAVMANKKFVDRGTGKTMSIQIRGYDPIVKEATVRFPISEKVFFLFEP